LANAYGGEWRVSRRLSGFFLNSHGEKLSLVSNLAAVVLVVTRHAKKNPPRCGMFYVWYLYGEFGVLEIESFLETRNSMSLRFAFWPGGIWYTLAWLVMAG
jgi:hypothetical protein